jgi:hypothetical protein
MLIPGRAGPRPSRSIDALVIGAVPVQGGSATGSRASDKQEHALAGVDGGPLSVLDDDPDLVEAVNRALARTLPSQAHLTGEDGGPAELRIRWMTQEEAY